MAAAWRQPVPDHLWDYLVEKGYVGEVEEGRMPVGDLIGEAQQIRAAARTASSDDNDIARQAAGAAASARIDALSAIYAAWARQDLEVQRFRSHPLLASGLLAPDEVGPCSSSALPAHRTGTPTSTCSRLSRDHGQEPRGHSSTWGTSPMARSAGWRWTSGRRSGTWPSSPTC
jgi:hypothetical protein